MDSEAEVIARQWWDLKPGKISICLQVGACIGSCCYIVVFKLVVRVFDPPFSIVPVM